MLEFIVTNVPQCMFLLSFTVNPSESYRCSHAAWTSASWNPQSQSEDRLDFHLFPKMSAIDKPFFDTKG